MGKQEPARNNQEILIIKKKQWRDRSKQIWLWKGIRHGCDNAHIQEKGKESKLAQDMTTEREKEDASQHIMQKECSTMRKRKIPTLKTKIQTPIRMTGMRKIKVAQMILPLIDIPIQEEVQEEVHQVKMPDISARRGDSEAQESDR